jgi:ATP-binding cassette subfamily B protein/subfamily B ATP-binding cassette protein MsbA
VNGAVAGAPEAESIPFVKGTTIREARQKSERGIGSRRQFDDYRQRRRDPVEQASRAKSQRQRSLPRLLLELTRILGGDWRVVLVGVTLGTASTLLKLAPAASTKLAIDHVLLGQTLPAWLPAWVPVPDEPGRRLLLLVAAVMATILAGSLLSLAGRWLVTRTSKRVQERMRRRVFAHASRLPLHRIYQLRAGGAGTLLRDDAGGIGELVFTMLFNPWRALVQFVGGLVILAWIDWRMLLCSLLLVPAVAASSVLWSRILRPLHRDIRAQRADVDARTGEVFGGMRVVRAFGRQRREAVRYSRANHLTLRLEFLSWWWGRILEVFWDLLLPGASSALLLYGGMEVLAGRLTPGDLVMFLVFMAMLLEPVAVIAGTLGQLQGNLAGFDRVLDLLAEPLDMAAALPGARLARGDVAGRIGFDRVSFRYPGSSVDVLHEITLDVTAGETIALVGRSGSGKTTLCNLVARFYDPTAGVVSLDGRDVRSIDVESYRGLLGVVEQDVFLFDGTIAENIAYARRDAGPDEIAAAARAAHASGFIDAMPEGYGTLIGERGVRISGGQRQRLAIARAILADARILILDEATSNLDSESEIAIQAGLAGLLRGRTSFIIAHRLSTIRHADRIVVLEEGRIVEIGSHDTLLARGGRYAEMVALQAPAG